MLSRFRISYKHSEHEPELKLNLHKGRELVGHLAVTYAGPVIEGREFAAVDIVWVKPGYQRQGLGSLLYDKAIEYLCAAGFGGLAPDVERDHIRHNSIGRNNEDSVRRIRSEIGPREARLDTSGGVILIQRPKQQ